MTWKHDKRFNFWYQYTRGRTVRRPCCSLKAFFISMWKWLNKSCLPFFRVVFRRVCKIAKKKRPLASSCLSVRPFARSNSTPTGRIFYDIWYLRIFRKSVEKIQVSLKSDKNKDYFKLKPIHIFILSRSVLLRMRNASDRSCRANQNTHFIFSNFIFRKSWLLWDNVEKYGRAGQAICDNMAHVHCMLDTDTNTHSEYVIIIAFPLQQWLYVLASMLRYTTYSACLVTIIIIHETIFLFSRHHPGVLSAVTRDLSDRCTCNCLPTTISFAFQLNQYTNNP